MSCIECGETKFSFNERIGESVCDGCGLVEITDIFEQSVSMFSPTGEVIRSADFAKTLGSIHRGKYQRGETNIQVGLVYCNLVLSSIAVNHPLRDRVEECYISLFRGHIFNNLYDYETRATALVYYVLKENGIAIRLSEVKKEFDCDMRKVNKLTRKIATHFGNSGVYARDNTVSMLDRTAREVSDTVEFLTLCQEMHIMLEPKLEALCFTKGRTYCASICCIVATANCMQITQKELGEVTGYTPATIRIQAQKILAILGYNSLREIKGKTIEEMNENVSKYT
jgi:transcription initiation factor TFIIIB Brf1 subunit/transcription initiation factor TFIIB